MWFNSGQSVPFYNGSIFQRVLCGSGRVYSSIISNLHSAPTAAPSNVSVTEVTSSTITVQWGMVPCTHQNGPITGYSVRYGVMGSGSTQTETVSGASETETTISDLMPSTNYSIDVAAINKVGTGVYNDPLTTVTDGMKYKNTVVCIVSCFVDLFSVSVNTSSNTSLTLSLTLSESITATTYFISYSTTDTDCFTGSNITSVDGNLTMYTLTGLEEGTEYSITVTAALTGGGTEQDNITANTTTAGESTCIWFLLLYDIMTLSQLHLPLPLL